MTNKKTDEHLWDDSIFEVLKWEEMTKYKLESIRRTAEIAWNRKVTIQEVAEIAIDFAYKGLSLKLIKDRFL